MMRFTKKVDMPAKDILDLAEAHFSKGGLSLTDRTASRVCMENDVGFVTVQVKVMTTGELDIITDGFDERAKQFLKIVK